MASITFNQGTLVPPSWLNDVDGLVYSAAPGTGVTKEAWMTAMGAISNARLSAIRGISVMDVPYGAAGDGVTNDTAAINAAETAAFAAGGILLFPPGRSFLYAGQFTCRVPIIGYGALLKQVTTSESLTGFVFLNGLTNPWVRGLKIDGISKCRPLLATSCTGLKIADVHVINALFGGISIYDSSDIDLSCCTVDGVVYEAAATAADGFYVDNCQNVRGVNNYAKNFRRIGFVAEGTSGKSDLVKWTNCHASDASHCDDSATEYNAGFWHENTDNIDYVSCSAKNIASGIGQSSGRVRGFVGNVGSSAPCTWNYVNCGTLPGTTFLPYGMTLLGTSQRPTVNVVNFFAKAVKSGVYSTGGLDVLNIVDLKGDDINAAAGDGLIGFDITGSAINAINVDKVSESTATYATDAGTINFFTGNTATVYTARNLNNVTHVMRQMVGRIDVDSSTVNYGSLTYSSFLASTELRFGSKFRCAARSGATTKLLFATQAMTSGVDVYFQGQMSESSWFQHALGGTANLWLIGAKLKNVGFSIQMSGSFTHKIADCDVEGADATHGFWESSATAFTRWELYVDNCRFTGGVPLRKSTGNPTFGHFVANRHVNATLHDFTTGVTVANNLNTP